MTRTQAVCMADHQRGKSLATIPQTQRVFVYGTLKGGLEPKA
jgi:hypothetical protein